MSVATIIRLLNSLKALYLAILFSLLTSNIDYRSSWERSLWIATEGKLHSTKSLFSSIALVTVLTKIMTWLNTSASSKSLSLRFFSFSASLMKYCFNPCKVSFVSLSIIISKGYKLYKGPCLLDAWIFCKLDEFLLAKWLKTSSLASLWVFLGKSFGRLHAYLY